MIQEIIVGIVMVIVVYAAFRKAYKSFKNKGNGACLSCPHSNSCNMSSK